MRSRSVYSLDCICGHHIESESTELVCPDCQREIRIEWPAETEENPPAGLVTVPIAA
jgi:hypothetical protein